MLDQNVIFNHASSRITIQKDRIHLWVIGRQHQKALRRSARLRYPNQLRRELAAWQTAML